MNYFTKIVFSSACVLFWPVSLMAALQTDSPEVFLRWDFDRENYYIAVKSNKDFDTSADYTSTIKAAIYQDGKLLTTPTVGHSDGMGSDFTLLFDNTAWVDRTKVLTLAVFSFPTQNGENGFLVPVSLEFNVSLKKDSVPCGRGFAILVDTEKYQPPITSDSSIEEFRRNTYLLRRADHLYNTIISNEPKARVDAYNREAVSPADVRLGQNPRNPESASFILCSYIETNASGAYDLELAFQNDSLSSKFPVELANRLLILKTQTQSRKPPDAAKLDEAPKSTGKRPLDDNLDIQVLLTSSVKDEDREGVMTRFRDTKWKAGIRLAPWLNVLKEPDIDRNTFYFLTPFFVDARVSSGEITKDTLSLNRVYLGSEFEIRHYSSPTTYPTYQRWIIRAQNASDRDFKQVEFTGGLEFQPVFSKFNRPLKSGVTSRRPILNPDKNAPDITNSNSLGFGYQFLPQAGFQLGKAYRNKNPIAAINQTDFVRRFYVGGTLHLDLTSYVRLSVTDILYFRGERPESVRHNYFNGTVEMPLPSWSKSIGNAFYLSFERGGQPPFATPDVNSFTAGYRIQWHGWFDRFR